ncbi:MAG TPA: lytic transglycosylase domain-containing protein [Acetobacteraceae bacterium]|nr:lytic transglycosylase domain-containing protein [Acetobacteraceae bacterium]
MLTVVLAVVGNYSVAQAQGAGETADQTALAVPRMGLRGAAGVALPQPLSPSEAAQVRRIFSLQGNGSTAEAARETDRLQNDLLLGPILADRYLRGRPAEVELTAWLVRFGDQPDGPAIRGLLERLAPASTPPSAADPLPSPRRAARRTLPGSRPLFVQNRDAEALAAARMRPDDAGAQFIGGLAALRLGQGDAADLFGNAYRLAPTSARRVAGAFWAARVAQRGGDRGGFAIWMRRAALEGDTFYGLIARRALGPAFACVPGATLGNADMEALLATPQGRRAFALLQVGEKRLAEAELRALWVDTAQDGVFDRSIVLAARATGFTQLAAEIEQNGIPRPDGATLVRLRPASGFLVDPPLVYALVRHESNFRAAAVSSNGARGLMQIMPRTAHAVAGGQANHLQDPEVNLAIGQQYLLALAQDDAIDGDLIRLLAGYGQGQFGLRKWVDAVHDDGDPLMFIEAIPNGHTRAFIEDALVYSWHYAAELHLPATSLDALAAGRYPRLVRAGEDARTIGGGACAR